MTAIHASRGRVYGHGIDMSTVLKSFESEWEIETADSTVLIDTARKHEIGLGSGTFKGEGLVSATPGELYDILATALGTTDNVLAHLPIGDVHGYPMIGVYGSHTKGGTSSMTDEVALARVEGVTQNGLTTGHILRPLAASTGTVNGASLDNAAATANGGEAFLVATAFTGTSVTFKLQHSVDDSVWADLGTFTAVSAAGGQRLLIAAGTTVRRYTRIAITGGTFTTVTAFGGFARN